MRVHIFYDNVDTYNRYNDIAYSTITEVIRKTSSQLSFSPPIVAGANTNRLINFQTFEDINDSNGQFLLVESLEKGKDVNVSKLEDLIEKQSQSDMCEFDETRFLNSVEDLKKESFNEFNKLKKEEQKKHDKFFDDYVILITNKFVQSLGYTDPILRTRKRNKRRRKEYVKMLGPTVVLSTAIPEQIMQIDASERTSNFLIIDEHNGQSRAIPRVFDAKDFFQTLIYCDLAKHMGVCSKYYEKLRESTNVELDLGERYCSDSSCSLSLRPNDFDEILRHTRARFLGQNAHLYCDDCMTILRKMHSKKVKAKVRTYLR